MEQEGVAASLSTDVDGFRRLFYSCPTPVLLIQAGAAWVEEANGAANELLASVDGMLSGISLASLFDSASLSRLHEVLGVLERGEPEARFIARIGIKPSRRMVCEATLASVGSGRLALFIREPSDAGSLSAHLDEAEAASAQIPLGFWACECDHACSHSCMGRVIHWSEGIYRILGLDPATTPDMTIFLDRLHPDDRPRYLQAWEGAMADPERASLAIDYRIVRPDGGVRACRSGVRFHRALDGRPSRILGTVQDLSERHALEASLRSKDELLRALFETEGLIVAILDETGRVVRTNPAVEAVSGYAERELRGRPVWETLLPRSQEGYCQNQLARVLTEGISYIRSEWNTRGGEQRRIAWSAGAVGREGARYILCIGTDVTDVEQTEDRLAEAENRYSKLIDLSFDIDLIACDGLVVSINQAGARLLGGEPEEFIDRPILDLLAENHRAPVEQQLRDVIESWQPAPLVERELIRRDGSVLPVEVAAIPVIYHGRHAIHAVSRDISHRKQIEQELEGHRRELEHRVEQRTAELETLNRELEAFSYSVSHDLRRPLRKINTFGRSLLEDYDGCLEEGAGYYLNGICSGTEEMADLIDDLLELSRIGQHDLRREPVDLSRLADGIVAELRATEPERAVMVKVGDGVVVEGDRRLLAMLLRNLLENAWKYTGRTVSPAVEIGVELQAGEKVCFVRDNGVGFAPEFAEQLFLPFRRFHSEFEGTGVGLSTVRRIVERHGGRVWAEGRPGQGATFFFTLG